MPSTSFTWRPRQRQPVFARALTSSPTACVKPVTIESGKRSRALQYPPVRTLCTPKPSARRCAAQPLTAFWHEPSASNACRMNIDSVTVGGYSRSRCSGRCDSVTSSSSGPVRRLKKPTASTRCASSADLLSMLLGMKLGITLSQGWPRGWFGGCW